MNQKMEAILYLVRNIYESGDSEMIDGIKYYVQGISKISDSELMNIETKFDKLFVENEKIIHLYPQFRGSQNEVIKSNDELRHLFDIIKSDLPELIQVIKYLIAFPDYRRIILQDLEAVTKNSVGSNS